jgi:hypothetical protein
LNAQIQEWKNKLEMTKVQTSNTTQQPSKMQNRLKEFEELSLNNTLLKIQNHVLGNKILKMEGVVAHSTRIHGRSNSRKLGNGLIQWTSLPIGAVNLSHFFPIIQGSKFFKEYKKIKYDVTLFILLYVVLF